MTSHAPHPRAILPFGPHRKIASGKLDSFYKRPCQSGFRARRLVIRNPEDWMIGKITAGNKILLDGRESPASKQEMTPGRAFSFDQESSPLAQGVSMLDGDELRIFAEYVGSDETGGDFKACVFGTFSEDPDPPARPIYHVHHASARAENTACLA